MKSFKVEIVGALTSGAASLTLIEIVERHKDAGLSQQAAYDALEELFTEFDCQQIGEEGSPTCGMLGGLMDRVWGYCSSKDAIWDVSLSGKSLKPYTPRQL